MQIHLNTYGTYLHVKDQMFEVKYKKEKETRKQHIAAHKVKSIWVGQGIALSSEAVKLALRNNIDIVFLEYDGKPIGRVWHSKLGSTTLIRKKQLEASLGTAALSYVKNWLTRKLQRQLDLLQSFKKHRPQHLAYLTDRMERIQQLQLAIQTAEAKHLDNVAEQLRGWEGTAGRLYFGSLSHVLTKPYQFSGRSSRPAQDNFNAFLNYAYGVLYSRVEKVLILAGVDPYVGFLHRDDYNYKSMVYDFIEPYRCYADKTVFGLFSAKRVNQSHTDDITNGFRLNNTGKVLLMEAFNKYLEEDRIRYKGKNQTRANIMQLEAHQFAQELLNN
ncbi:MAG: CRISPR-associated endonuclease Cas1 [Saprospiraceae bacterium]